MPKFPGSDRGNIAPMIGSIPPGAPATYKAGEMWPAGYSFGMPGDIKPRPEPAFPGMAEGNVSFPAERKNGQ